MYLQSLEIVGFKSFADPTLITFDRGVTAIVGPNGCGKSNVLDSIRWVLGEQSAKALRGGNMQDVIFSGTDSRRSLGMAEVTMHFAECEQQLGTDYHEVRITRRVFRDGRSEYEINKTPCRLKDIHALFMDTGIGRSAYSIMEQGKIDKILSAKPEDRREVFEEAAGITRFKAHKKEALRKLEATEANLIRVGDILKELTRQIGSLQRQASKARRYKEIQGRLTYLDTRLAAHLYKELKEKLDAGESRIQALQAEFSAIQAELDQHEASLLEQRRRAEELEIEIRSLSQERSLAESAVEKARQSISFNEQRIGELSALQERCRAEIAANAEKASVLAGQLERLEGEERGMQEVLTAINGELESRNGELETARRRVSENLKERTRLEQQLAQTDRQLGAIRQRLAAMELQQRSYVVRMEKLAEEEKVLQERGQDLESRAAAARQAHETFQGEWKSREASIADLSRRVTEAAAALEAARKAASDRSADLARKEARCQVLAEILGSRAGYSDTTKELLTRFQGQGVAGTLLDQIEVEPADAKAIQRALGAAWEALLIESPEALDQVAATLAAQGATAVLADLGAGPGGGPQRSLLQKLALNFFGGKDGEPRASTLDPARAAIAFVRPSAKVRPLVERILEEFLVARDAAEAASLRRQFPSCHVVTRSGEVWFRNGLQLRGDDASAVASILEQEREFKTLKEELGGLRERASQAEQASESARAAVEQAEQDLQSARRTVQEAEGKAVSARYEAEALDRQVQEWKTALETVSREKVHLGEEESAGQSGRSELEREAADHDRRRQETVAAAEALTASLADLNAAVEAASQAVTEVRIRQAAQQQKAQTIHQELEVVLARRSEFAEIQRQREDEVASCEGRIAECREGIVQAEREIEGSTARASELGHTLTVRTEERQALSGSLAVIEETARAGRRKAGEVQSLCGREEIQVAEQRMKLEALCDRIRRAYEINLATLDASTLRPPAPEPKTPKPIVPKPAAGDVVEIQTTEGIIIPTAPAAPDAAVPSDGVVGAPEAEPATPDVAPATDQGSGSTDQAAATTDPTEVTTDQGPGTKDEPEAPVADLGQDQEEAFEEQEEEEIPEDPLLATDPIDWDAVIAEVNDLRDRIERMGPVNVEAITEYEELEQRLAFLTQQEQDLIKSRDQLHEAIKKINETTQVMFAETFEKIRVNFSEMFLELFGGGKAELILQDPNDPLECGIDIVARPPGKQLQSITLLSGGEKTMTAVAMLFAIYMVKPSPFCFLDEMDAPLDESNINRFIRILQRFVSQSQFVVITHNKRTISSADVLYGVTMEEHGVSKIVSVRLSRKEESPLFNGKGKEGRGREEEDMPPSIADSIRHGSLVTESDAPPA